MDVQVNGGLKETRGLYRTDSIKTVTGVSYGPGGQVVIADTGTLVKVGDTFRAETGPLAGQEIPVTAVSTNSFTIGTTTSPGVGSTYYTLRPVTSRTNPDGSIIASVSSGPVQYKLNGVDTTVNQDTTTPANSRGLPVVQLNTSGSQFDAATAARQDTGNTTLSSIDTKTPALQSGNVPVQLPASQITALTPPTTVTVQQPTGTNLHTVVDSSALPTGAATSALQSQLSNQLPTTLGQKAMAASLAVTIASDQSPTPAYAPDQVASATISALNTNLTTGVASANSTVSLTGLQGMAMGVFQLPTTGSGTILAQMTIDGNTWVNCSIQNATTGALSSNVSLAAAGIYQFESAGATAIRVTCNSYTSGTPTITLRSCARSGLVGLDAAIPAGSNSIGNITTVATITNPVTAAQSTAAAKTVKSALVTVGTTALRATTDAAAVTAGRVVLRIKPSVNNTGNVYLGPSTVTTAAVPATAGMLVLPAETFELNFDAGDYYLIADTAGQLVHILEQE